MKKGIQIIKAKARESVKKARERARRKKGKETAGASTEERAGSGRSGRGVIEMKSKEPASKRSSESGVKKSRRKHPRQRAISDPGHPVLVGPPPVPAPPPVQPGLPIRLAPTGKNGSGNRSSGSSYKTATSFGASYITAPSFRDILEDRAVLRGRGAQLVRWIENPSEADCPFQPHSLTRRDIFYLEGSISDSGSRHALRTIEDPLYLPSPASMPRDIRDYIDMRLSTYDLSVDIIASPNIINIERMFRAAHAYHGSPYVSDCILTMFQTYFWLDDLRYIFVSCIINAQTAGFIRDVLYKDRILPGGNERLRRMSRWSDDILRTSPVDSMPTEEPAAPVDEREIPDDDTPDCYPRGTQEYEEILGTRIGRTVAAIVLGGFARGTRQITNIYVYEFGGALQLRFDIGEAPMGHIARKPLPMDTTRPKK
ncbi:hypothetical protein N7494_007867 [Penicillium frequentans]|uniref:Uncharacterized protein n=1 Tax=Penicillium frequentans TaxID=3151616 RepID=A0AAD6CTM0_9EURO|nr:hypothetical protein N7494_007867 [Penicillium glabrum]